MITAIIFDLGGVLFTNGTRTFLNSLADRYTIPFEDIKDVFGGELGKLHREGKLSRDEYWEKALTKLNIKEDIDKLEDEWVSEYHLIEGTKEIIFQLSKNYKIYYLSNNTKERIEKINNKHDFLQWFEAGIFSHEVGVKKPHPDIYKASILKANVQPNEALFIDDLEENLPTAEELGMKTILFENPEQLRVELTNLKVL